MPHPGQLRTRVTFLKAKDESERTGQPVVEFVPAFDAWAAVESLGPRELAQFRQGGFKSTARLTIRWQRTQPNTRWQVKVEGETYYIESITHDRNVWTYISIYRDGR